MTCHRHLPPAAIPSYSHSTALTPNIRSSFSVCCSYSLASGVRIPDLADGRVHVAKIRYEPFLDESQVRAMGRNISFSVQFNSPRSCTDMSSGTRFTDEHSGLPAACFFDMWYRCCRACLTPPRTAPSSSSTPSSPP